MKIQCNVCEAAEANVLCCADEAALCWSCDDKVHAANKLASKHHRVPLSNSSSSHIPKCDICQENVGYFFCLEDRALLCRKCDVAIHNANSYVSAHQRFLLTGVKVGLEASEPDGSSTKIPNSAEKMEAKVPQSVCRSSSMSLTRENNEVVSRQVAGIGSASATKISFSGGTTVGSITEWPLDDFLGLSDLSQNSVFMEHGPSKTVFLGWGQGISFSKYMADSGKLGESLSPISLVANEDFEHDDCLSKVPEIQWTVPEIPSPPTASGLFWPKSIRNSTSENVASVPDVCCSSPQNLHRYQPTSTALKHRRQY